MIISYSFLVNPQNIFRQENPHNTTTIYHHYSVTQSDGTKSKNIPNMKKRKIANDEGNKKLMKSQKYVEAQYDINDTYKGIKKYEARCLPSQGTLKELKTLKTCKKKSYPTYQLLMLSFYFTFLHQENVLLREQTNMIQSAIRHENTIVEPYFAHISTQAKVSACSSMWLLKLQIRQQ